MTGNACKESPKNGGSRIVMSSWMSVIPGSIRWGVIL